MHVIKIICVGWLIATAAAAPFEIIYAMGLSRSTEAAFVSIIVYYIAKMNVVVVFYAP